MEIVKFPRSIIEHLGCYIYTLSDPANNTVFYIGKGKGNRVFAHANASLKNPNDNDKVAKIREIRKRGKTVKYEIIRHGMTEEQALEVESALIDFVGLPNLTNEVAGYDMEKRGRMGVEEIIALYKAKPITIAEPAILVLPNKLFTRNISATRLYEITRGNWVVGDRRNRAKYAFCIYRGIVREIYKINQWFPIPARDPETKTQDRWRFKGEVSWELQHYKGGSVEAYLKPRAQNPVRYINC